MSNSYLSNSLFFIRFYLFAYFSFSYFHILFLLIYFLFSFIILSSYHNLSNWNYAYISCNKKYLVLYLYCSCSYFLFFTFLKFLSFFIFHYLLVCVGFRPLSIFFILYVAITFICVISTTNGIGHSFVFYYSFIHL